MRHPNGCTEGNRLKLPKLGWLRCPNAHEHSEVKSVTLKQLSTRDGYACCVYAFIGQPPKKSKQPIGIDLGLKDVTVMTDGTELRTGKTCYVFS